MTIMKKGSWNTLSFTNSYDYYEKRLLKHPIIHEFLWLLWSSSFEEHDFLALGDDLISRAHCVGNGNPKWRNDAALK
jgi:hypothetical protein